MPHAPAALGNIVPLAGDLPEGSPPTSYAAHAALKGEPRALAAFAGLTLLRSLIIAPGLALAGIRGKTLVYGALAASGTISASALAYVFVHDRKRRFEAASEAARSSYAAAAGPVHEQGTTEATAEAI